MKKLTLIFVMAVIVAAGCSDDDSGTDSDGPATVTVDAGATATFSDLGISVTFDSVFIDFRRPRSIALSQDAGFAEIVVTISGHPERPLRMPIDAFPPDSADAEFPGLPVRAFGHVFRLLDLDPYPENDLPIPDSLYTATLMATPDETAVVDRSTILPLERDFWWTYAETTWIDGTISSVDSTRIQVVAEYTDILGDWWVLTQSIGPLPGEIMRRNDSLFERQVGGIIRQYGGIDSYAEKIYIPAQSQPVTYDMILQGDLLFSRTVQQFDTVLNVPADTFDLAWLYTGQYFNFRDRRIFLSPDTAFVFEEALPDTLGIGPEFERRTWLTEYFVGQDTTGSE